MSMEISRPNTGVGSHSLLQNNVQFPPFYRLHKLVLGRCFCEKGVKGLKRAYPGLLNTVLCKKYAHASGELGPYPSDSVIPRLARICSENLISDCHVSFCSKIFLLLRVSWWGKYYQYFDFTSGKKKKKTTERWSKFLETAQLKSGWARTQIAHTVNLHSSSLGCGA